MSAYTLRGYLLAILLPFVAAALLWPLRDDFSLGNFSLIYLLIVLIVAIQRGTKASLLAALVSFLCFNFFLIKPFFTFLVADPRDLITLVIFLVCATLTGQLASYARRQTEFADQRAYEQHILNELSSSLNQITDSDSVHTALKQVFINVADISLVELFPNAPRPPSSDPLV